MKQDKKSALNSMKGILFAFFFLLVGCADTSLPSWLSGEPGSEGLKVTRLSHEPKPLSDEDDWPSLADVPTEKPVFSAPIVLEERARILEDENDRAHADAKRLKNIAVPKTLREEKEAQKVQAPPLSFAEKMRAFFALKP